ncbi:MAG: cysteine hydrolase family protein [Sporolactobacillus sp.]
MINTALLIIDVQNSMFSVDNPVFDGEKLIRNIKFLLLKARSKSIPVYYIQHNGSAGSVLENGTNGWKIRPEIYPSATDTLIQKTTPDSFLNTNLDESLKSQGITNLVLTGIQSEVCVDTTCRRAFSLGYEVTLVTDAHSTWDTAELTAKQIINHHNQVLKWFASTQTTEEILF